MVKVKEACEISITLEAKDVEDVKDAEGNTNDKYTVKPVHRQHLVMADTFWCAPAES